MADEIKTNFMSVKPKVQAVDGGFMSIKRTLEFVKNTEPEVVEEKVEVTEEKVVAKKPKSKKK